jgi:ribonuclease HII
VSSADPGTAVREPLQRADIAERTRPKARRGAPGPAPSLRHERDLLRSGHTYVAAVDEVGRGALAGPVTVGVVVVDIATKSAPSGVRDSKLLTPEARRRIAPKLRRWAPVPAVGHASPDEIDEIGIIAALRLAGCRALAMLPLVPDCALLDGNHNWLSIPVPKLEQPPYETAELFEFEVQAPAQRPAGGSEIRADIIPPRVVTQIKADMRCAAVAAASVLAKVERDAIMVKLAGGHPEYGWELNKGYSAPEHIAALRRVGPCELHRRSWNLPGRGGILPGGTEPIDLDALDALDGLDALDEVDGLDGLDGEELDGVGAKRAVEPSRSSPAPSLRHHGS